MLQFHSTVLILLLWQIFPTEFKSVGQSDQTDNHDAISLVEIINEFRQSAGKTDLIYVEDLPSLPPGDLCGHYVNESRSQLILGGQNVNILGKHPWTLSLSMGGYHFHRCGAALITRSWTLSAAHCVQGVDVTSQHLYLLGGMLSIAQPLSTSTQKKRVDKALYHSQFDRMSFEQDIALLHVAEPFELSIALLPVCLPSPHADFLGKTATLTGWGRMGHRKDISQHLQYVEMPFISNEMCMNWYQGSGSTQVIPEYTFLCSGMRNGSKDACSGDSGGPITAIRDDGRVELAGLVSWGLVCGTPGQPGVYTRVSKFLDWIEESMNSYIPWDRRIYE